MKRITISFFIILGLYHEVSAQITYHDISPDTTVNTWNSFSFAPFGGAKTATGNYVDIWWHPNPEVVVNCWNDFQLLCSGMGSNPLKLNTGDSITASGNWQKTTYTPLNSSGTGNWISDATDKYLGFRIKSGGIWNYGWLKMSVAAGAASFTVKAWALNTAGAKINAGQTTTTRIGEITTNNTSLQVHPNPATDKLYIILPADKTGDVATIHDITGKQISRMDCRDEQVIISIRNYSAGVYTIRFAGYSARFVKQ